MPYRMNEPPMGPNVPAQVFERNAIQPRVGCYVLMAVLACWAFGVHAQSNTATETALTIRPANEEAVKPAEVDRWWVLFTEPVAQDLGLSEDVFRRLRELDTRHYDAYWDLGQEPSQHPRYLELSHQRTAAVKPLLTPKQFKKWSEQYDPLRPR